MKTLIVTAADEGKLSFRRAVFVPLPVFCPTFLSNIGFPPLTLLGPSAMGPSFQREGLGTTIAFPWVSLVPEGKPMIQEVITIRTGEKIL